MPRSLSDKLTEVADDLTMASDTLRVLARVTKKGKLPKRANSKVLALLRSVETITEKLRRFGTDDAELDTLLDEEGR